MSQTISASPTQEAENKVETGSERLTDPARELFCQELVASGDKYASFEAAGFKRPRGNVDRMMREPDVAERIGFLYRKVAPLEQLLIAHRRHEHRKALEHLATADRLDLYVERIRYVIVGKKKRKVTALELKPLDELTSDQRALVDSVKLDEYGRPIEFVMPKRLDARAMLAKLDGFDAPQKIAPTNPAGDGPAQGTIVIELVDSKNGAS